MLAAELLPEAALVLGPDGLVQEANGLAAEVFGVAVEELVGRPLTGRLADPEALTIEPGGDGLWRAELEAYRADGVPFPLDVSARVLPDARTLLILRDNNAVAERVNSLAQQHFEWAFDSSPIGMALYDTDGRFARVNDAMCALLGRTREKLIGTRDQELTHVDDRQADLDAAERILAGEISVWQTEKRFVRPTGEIVWAIANLTFLRAENRRPIAWLGQFQDVTVHRELAERDALTGLCNLRRFREVLAEQLQHGIRYPPPGALIVFDLDGLKAVNDSHGHRAGDEVLLAVAQAVTASVRESDCVARIGGDEFAVVLDHVDAVHAEAVGEKITRLISSLSFDFDGDRPVITASVGITPFSMESCDPEPVLEAADQASYEAKRAGGDRWVVRLPETSRG